MLGEEAGIRLNLLANNKSINNIVVASRRNVSQPQAAMVLSQLADKVDDSVETNDLATCSTK